MPYQILWKKRGVCVCCIGNFTLTDHVQISNELYRDPRIDTVQYIIRDLSNVDIYRAEDGLDTDQMALPVAIDRGASYYLKALKVALVAKDPHLRQLCQQYIELSYRFRTHWYFQLFSNLADAQHWVSTEGSSSPPSFRAVLDSSHNGCQPIVDAHHWKVQSTFSPSP